MISSNIGGSHAQLCQIDVAINAPAAGTMKELLVEEDSTVTVGQDIAYMDEGGAPSEESSSQGKSDEVKETPSTETKEEPAAPVKQEEKSSPPAAKEPEPLPTASPTKQEAQPQSADKSKIASNVQSQPPPPKPQSQPQPPKPQESKSQDSKASATPVLGSREERRVCPEPRESAQ